MPQHFDGPMGIDVWNFRPVSLCVIDDRVNSLLVNSLWNVLEPGCDLEWCFRRPDNLSVDNLIGRNIFSAKEEAHVERN
ncbi:hypothetical protein [Sulfitobacter sp. 915]|uniref:hypothetical protein n=1 Tax=Sulfitobacter sp. 915 TaxID=3368558 RepID=UPI003746B41C